jgi:hypothetical protein
LGIWSVLNKYSKSCNKEISIHVIVLVRKFGHDFGRI